MIVTKLSVPDFICAWKDGFGSSDARVVCRQLGYSSGNIYQ